MGRLSRRELLAAGMLTPALGRASGSGSRIEAREADLRDSLTERRMSRLTDPAVLHHLPHYHQRFVARRGSGLLLAGETGGSRQIYYLEPNRGRATQLTEGPGVHPYSATLGERDRSCYYLQGSVLAEGPLRGRGGSVLFQTPGGWRPTGHLTISTDFRYAALIEMKEGDEADDPAEQFTRRPHCRLRVVDLKNPSDSRILAEERRWLTHPQFRPGGREILYLHAGPWAEVEDRLRLAALGGKGAKSLRPREGTELIGSGYWSADGSLAYYVHFPDGTLRGATVRAVQPETGEERVVSPCSAFGWMQNNQDGTAIVGASLRPSGPNIYVLFTRLQREMTLCEHYSSGKPYPIAGTDRKDYYCAQPSPVFSDDSQWVYFTSDREGLPAVYRMKVEDLVEET